MDLLLRYNDVAVDGDSSNTAGAYVKRGSSGEINVGDLNCLDLVPTAAIWLTKTALLTGTVTIDATKNVVRGDATGGNVTINLPAASTVAGLILWIKRVDASGNTFTIKGAGTENIDNANTQTLGARGHMVIYSNGTTWDILA